ncbi:hypothetical protein P775_16355 [Puniceibacterium antarcticum]|uniref:YjiS-like domain-containing protein n=1 Tax=Puniceibacterium antarcticum TaxID=1206336 RepID=A0A2G8RCD1_9RHOB|nr:DUF1127 domain-containing protein [Puniceibacterium antarcticum]PIL19153.1 hypothetical protein P775_16355 [Puniceibacterium antarcticum]
MTTANTSHSFGTFGHAGLIGNIFVSALDTPRSRDGSSTSAQIFGLFTSTYAAVSAWNDSRITRKALSALTDRELDDIGLTRGDIDAVARR